MLFSQEASIPIHDGDKPVKHASEEEHIACSQNGIENALIWYQYKGPDLVDVGINPACQKADERPGNNPTRVLFAHIGKQRNNPDHILGTENFASDDNDQQIEKGGLGQIQLIPQLKPGCYSQAHCCQQQ
jgi:hypothetical protein